MLRRAVMTLAMCALVLTGCAAAPSSSRLTAADLDEVAAAMAQSLQASDALRLRSADAPGWVVTMHRPENLSSDMITVSERWYLVERLRSSLPLASLSRERNLMFVLPAEHAAEQSASQGAFTDRRPTHELTASIRSVTRQAELHRTDAYAIQFRLSEIDNGERVWSGEYFIKRAAFGRAWD
ncbi:MAG: hypothetical protein KF866_02470 [Phycisphaeraceae bacterium]|nr:hypothetical protein [Phycisphaeraceae bacterium]